MVSVWTAQPGLSPSMFPPASLIPVFPLLLFQHQELCLQPQHFVSHINNDLISSSTFTAFISKISMDFLFLEPPLLMPYLLFFSMDATTSLSLWCDPSWMGDLSPVLTGAMQLWVLVSCDWSFPNLDTGEQCDITPSPPWADGRVGGPHKLSSHYQ